jgi:hypothetical protein
VVNNHGRHGHSLAFADIGEVSTPSELSGVCVDSPGLAIEHVVENLS